MSKRTVSSRLTWAGCVLGFCLGAPTTHVAAQAGARNLIVELRWVGDEDVAKGSADHRASTGFRVSTQDARDDVPGIQTLRVANGQRGTLRLSKSTPFVWTESAAAFPGSRAASGSATSSTPSTPATPPPTSGTKIPRGAVSQALTWIEAGQTLSVKPRWPGGRAPAAIELQIDSATMDGGLGSALPAREQLHLATIVTTPLGRWTTVASTGPTPDAAGTWSTAATASAHQVLQMRIRSTE